MSENEKCPCCKKKTLIDGEFIKVIGTAENIPWACVKCPDEVNCGYARAK